MSNIKCEDCSYYWKEDNEPLPMCQFFQNTCFDIPPCEYEDIFEESDDDLIEEQEILFAIDDDEFGKDE